MNRKKQIAALKRIYASLPKLNCKGKCQAGCSVISMSSLEYERMVNSADGEEPHVRKDLSCTMLVNGRCKVYDARPTICRLFGMMRAMKCPWGCVPEYWLSDEEGYKILNQISMLTLSLPEFTNASVEDVEAWFERLDREPRLRWRFQQLPTTVKVRQDGTNS